MAVNIKKDFDNTRRKPDITNLVYGKVPPQDIDAESALLGAMILDKHLVPDILPIIPMADAFYTDAHQKIYDAILTTYDSGSPIDMLTVTQTLRKAENLELVGGPYYLTQLTMSVVSGAHATAHARIIIEKFISRELIRVAGTIVGEAYADTMDTFDLLAKSEAAIMDISKIVTNSSKTVHISTIAKECVDDAEAIINGEISGTGLMCGINSVDAVTSGWQKEDLIIIAARPAVGKTAFALNALINANVPALFFSLEMSRKQLYKRMAANTGSIPLDWITNPLRMNEWALKQWHSEFQTLSKKPIYVNDKAGISVSEVRAVTSEHVRKYGVQLVVIDYLQLMKCLTNKGMNREQQIASITRDLKEMAKDFEIPVISLCQMSRSVETRGDNKPKLSDLRESGAIEQDADVVCFLYGSSDPQLKNIRNFDIAKHRNGVTDDMLLKFQGEYQRFTDNEKDPFAGTQVPYETQEDNPRAGITGYREHKPYQE